MIKSLLAKDILEEKNAHAYIIAGPSGSGKHTVAEQAAAALGCTGDKASDLPFPCGKCMHCIKVKRKVAPDVIYINRGDKATLGVEVVRDLKNDIYITPNEAKFKVYIIEEADKMTPQAQNAFLLSLEEPPKSVVFFMLTETPEDLLETVRSRAPILRTEQFSPGEIVNYVKTSGARNAISPDDSKRLSEAAAVSSGTIGQTLALMAETEKDFENSLSVRKFAETVFTALCGSSQRSLTDILAQMPKQRAECIELLTLIRLAIRDGCVIKKSPLADTVFFPCADDVKKIVKNVSFSKLFHLGEAVSSAILDIDRNVSQQTVLTSLILKKYS